MKQLNKEEIREYFDSLSLKEFCEIISSSIVFYAVPKYRYYWNLHCQCTHEVFKNKKIYL